MTHTQKTETEFSGRYLLDGEIFRLKVVPAADVRQKKTHLCKSATKFWDGTEADFKKTFTKV